MTPFTKILFLHSTQLAFECVSLICLGLGVGYGLDKKWALFPFLFIAGGICGTIGAGMRFAAVIRLLRRPPKD